MPVDRSRYPPDWESISRSVKDAAGWKCEFCGIAHGTEVAGRRGRRYKIVLTVAHLGPNRHDKMDCTNLKALCQPCHLAEDLQDHIAHARETRHKRRAVGSLFVDEAVTEEAVK